jgi:EAL and modified HD-GYP domain-containing signal transduction protein
VLFLTGLFSLIDALLDQPLESLLDRLPLPEIAVNTLLGKPSRLSPIRELMQACEQADWPTVDRCSTELGIPPGKASELYRASLEWARTALG